MGVPRQANPLALSHEKKANSSTLKEAEAPENYSLGSLLVVCWVRAGCMFCCQVFSKQKSVDLLCLSF